MATSSIYLFAFAAIVVLALGQESQEQVADAKHFVLSVWRNKQQCDGKPDLPLLLLNDPNKCQVVLKDFFWAKGSCQGDKLQGQVCTDAQCSSCFDLQDVAPQNECTFNDMLQGSYKYTCKATPQNISKMKQAGPPSAAVNQSLGEQVKQKIPEATSQDQGVASSELAADGQHQISKSKKPKADQSKDNSAVATQQTNQTQGEQKNQTQQKGEQGQQKQQQGQQKQQKQPSRGGQSGSASAISSSVALILPFIAVMALN